MKLRACFVACFLFAVVVTALAQDTAHSLATSTQVPRLIKFSGIARDEAGKPVSSVVGITFALYKDQQGGSPLWMETQNVHPDATGHYTVLLGSATANGIPLALFSSDEVQWISAQIAGQPEQPRVALLSVPYALKAADAETLGGMPASAFMHSNSIGSAAAGERAKSQAAQTAPAAGVTGKGTKNFIPIWTSGTALGNSTIFETGGNVGVGTKTPKAALDVAGTGTLGIQSTAPGTQSAIAGIATATSGGTTGVYGQSVDPQGNGVLGINNASSGGAGVIGSANATSGSAIGVTGTSASTTNFAAGVYGLETAKSGIVFGVNGNTSSTTAGAAGVNGFEGAATGAVVGVAGGTNSPTDGAVGVAGYNNATTGHVAGVNGSTMSATGAGVSGNALASGSGASAVGGGFTSASPNGTGVSGYASATSGAAIGVFGQTNSPAGVGAAFTNLGGGTSAVIIGNGANFKQIFLVDASGNGNFAGNLNVAGKLTKGSGSFKIDHPLDPANKYLSHSFVESPDMMNVYNGNITTDRYGLATVTLPDYFGALNRDFRYQLTVIGQFAQAIVKQEIVANRFVIKTNKPSVKVSWQVTGIRQDAYANADRIQVEEVKPPQERGKYLHPELFGASSDQAIGAIAAPRLDDGAIANVLAQRNAALHLQGSN